MTPGLVGSVLLGTVVDFDDVKGYGEVSTDDGRRLFFHCAAIADGSRSIAVGAEVAFQVAPGHGGRWEAASVVRLAPQAGEEPSGSPVAPPPPPPGP